MGTIHPTHPMPSNRWALVAALAAAVVLAGCGGEPSSAPDPDAARALYDRAVIAEMSGDTLGAEDLVLKLATEHPDTTHGRAARARLSSSGSLPVAMGIMAAVAVPAFARYSGRSKASEARVHLNHLSDSARAFYSEEQADREGNILAPGFPASAPPTPARPHCSGEGRSGFDPQPGDWDHPTWQALVFVLDDPHHYQYSFTVAGKGAEATFVARAVGDLDCDGVFSTFERRGRIEGGEVVVDPVSATDELE